MKIFTLFFLFLKVKSFLIIKPKILNKQILYSRTSLYEIKPLNTIIFYNLCLDHKNDIQNEINIKTNNRFEIKNNNIYISLYDCIEDNKTMLVCQIFVYVHDHQNKLDGQYILESKEYKYSDIKSLICSFYESNPIFRCSFSYYQYNLDNFNYDNYLSFDFIYKIINGEQIYLKNIGNGNNEQSYIPVYEYCSEFKYKNIFWEKSNKIIYYKNSFYYNKSIL